MQIINDSYCSWINNINKRTNIRTLSKNLECEWLIIGAGYTGLSAARKLAEIYPNKTITLIDAQLAGEGASSRNSGYLVDTTLNDGFTSDRDLDNYKKKQIFINLELKQLKSLYKSIKLTVISMNVENIMHLQKLMTKKYWKIFLNCYQN
jgi:L-2-hydroxyglutarate oxidase LhgO